MSHPCTCKCLADDAIGTDFMQSRELYDRTIRILDAHDRRFGTDAKFERDFRKELFYCRENEKIENFRNVEPWNGSGNSGQPCNFRRTNCPAAEEVHALPPPHIFFL